MVRTLMKLCIISMFLFALNTEPKRCGACAGLLKPLSDGRVERMMLRVPAWTLRRDSIYAISRTYTFTDFLNNITFINQVAHIANAYDHHPDMYIDGNQARFELYTHSSGRLSKTDFILAQKIDALFKNFVNSVLDPQCSSLSQDTALLHDAEIEAAISLLHGWVYDTAEHEIHKTYTFDNFSQTIELLNTLTPLLACYDGKALVYLFYNKLTVHLSYNNNGIRAREIEYAHLIDNEG